MHKTGSSAIQRFLSRNRWALGKLGVFYPSSVGPTGQLQPKHNAIFAAISHQADKGAPHPELGSAAALIDTTAAQIERAAPRTAILSAEGFSGERPIFAQNLRALADRFDVRVVVFLRRRDLWVESFYKQMVQSHDVAEVRPFHAFLAANATQRHMDYLTILNWWSEAFGENAITVTPFESGAGEPVHLFLAAAGLSPRLAYLPFSRGAVNVSCSAETTEVLRLANKQGKHATKVETSQIEAALKQRHGSFLTERERTDINRPFADDDAEILRRFTDRYRTHLFSDQLAPSRAEKWSGYATDDPRLTLVERFISG